MSASVSLEEGFLDARATDYLGRAATREVVPQLPAASVRWSTHGYPEPIAKWNFHPEYEVHLIRQGTGRYIIGDEVGSFGPGHLVIVGPDVPHDWISDLRPGEYIPERDVVLHFRGEWITQCAAVIPELGELETFLARSACGIEFLGTTAESGALELLRIGATEGAQQVKHIFGLLALLASAPVEECRILRGGWAQQRDSPGALEIVNGTIDYIMANIAGTVRLSRAADQAGMSASAFSRYFKSASGHTFSEMVTQLRLAQACRLLRTTSRPVATIAAEVGYTNLSNFNRQFRARRHVTPREYRRGRADRA